MSKPLKDVLEEGAPCPECHHGLVEVVEFGHGATKEVHAWCGGLNGDKDDGCGWEEIYQDKIPKLR